MSRTLRAIRFRFSLSLAFFALAVTMTAGTVVLLSYAELAGADPRAGGPLLLLGAVATAQLAALSTDARRRELGLAQLRGRHRFALLGSAVREPLALLVAGTAAGVLTGWRLARLALQGTTAGTASEVLTAQTWLAVALVLSVALAVVLVVTRRVWHEPLEHKLTRVGRPRPPALAARFGATLVLLAAVASVYETRTAGIGHTGWVGFVSPALVGLAAGQLGVWVLALLVRVAAHAQRSERAISRYLALRRVARSVRHPGLVRVVVAAVVVACVAGTAWLGADRWRDATARMRSGGPVSYPVAAGPFQAYAAAHRADPQGRWLMAMSAAPEASGGSARDVFVDARRWRAVVGPFFAGTPIAQVSRYAGALVAGPAPPIARGRSFTVTVTARSARRSLLTDSEARRERSRGPYHGYGFRRLELAVNYVDSQGDDQTLFADLRRSDLTAAGRGRLTYSVPIRVKGLHRPPCARACSVTSVQAQGVTHGALHVLALTFGSQRLNGRSAVDLALQGDRSLHVSAARRGFLVALGDAYGLHPLAGWTAPGRLPAVTTPGSRLEREHRVPIVAGLDGLFLPVRPRAGVTVLPLVGRLGTLADLATALRGAGGRIPGTTSLVVARADTPAAVIARLEGTGAVGPPRSYEQIRAAIDRAGTARHTVLYLYVALSCLVVAAISAVAGVSSERQERVPEAAALRVVGIGSGSIRACYAYEYAILGVVVLAASWVGGWLSCRALLSVLPLTDPGQFGVPFDARPPVTVLAGLAVAAGVFLAAVGFLGVRTVAASSPPRRLRDDE